MTGMESPESDPDSIFDLLGNRRRRIVCAHVFTSAEDVHGLGELADQIAEWERDSEAVSASDDHRERVVVDLHHCQLPKLADAGLVEYDARSRTVRYRESGWAGDVRDLLEYVVTPEERSLVE